MKPQLLTQPILSFKNQEYEIDNFIIMKVGSHGEESFQQIIERKNSEQFTDGFMLWGYSGNLLDVIETRNFLNSRKDKKSFILMSETKSPFRNTPHKSNFFSLNKKDWYGLPKTLYTTGCDKSVICRDLVHTELYLNLSLFDVASGPSKGKNLSDYLKFRTDKACAVYNKSNNHLSENIIRIDWIAEILPPYVVFLSRNMPLQTAVQFYKIPLQEFGVFKNIVK